MGTICQTLYRQFANTIYFNPNRTLPIFLKPNAVLRRLNDLSKMA